MKTITKDWVLVYEPWASLLMPFLNERSVTTISKISDIQHEVLVSAQTLFIIGPREWIDLYELLNIRQVYDVVIGLLPMTNPQQAADKLAKYKHIEIQGEDFIIDRINNGSTYSIDHLKIFPEGSINHFDELQEHLNSQFRYFSIVSHGRGDVVYLPYAVLCGKKENNSVQSGGNLPHCFYHNECFYKGRPIIKMQGIRSNILFLNSCSSLNGTDGLFHEDFGLDSEVFEREDLYALIGSPMNRYGDIDQSILFSILLDEGYSIGEIVRLIDDTVTIRNLEVRTLLIYGDPTVRLNKINNNNLYFIEKKTSSIKLNKHFKAIYFKEVPDENEIIFLEGPSNVKVLPTREGYFIISVQGLLVPGDYYVNRIDLSRYVDEVKFKVVNPIRNLSNLKLVGINPAAISGKLRELQMNSISIERDLIDLTQTFSKKGLQKLEKKISKFYTNILSVQKTVINELVKKTHKTNFHFFESYMKECIRETTPSEFRCIYCGKNTIKNKWIHPFLSNFKREVLQCLKCGYLSDQEVNAKHKVIIKSLTPLRLGKIEEIIVNFAHPVKKDSLIALCLVDINKYGEKNPVFSMIQLEEDMSDFVFTLSIPKGLPSHHYWLRLYVFNDEGIHTFGTNIFLTPFLSLQE